MEEKTIFTGQKAYLEKSFLEELNYKIWSTKGARFEAGKRYTTIARWSNMSMSILSAYIIIAGLASVYLSSMNIDFQLINYIITALSIILLVVSQFENNQNYKLQANNYHNCSLELSVLYNELRIFKTMQNKETDSVAIDFAKHLAEKYQNILEKYENHDSIDYDNFKLNHPEYFSKVTATDKWMIKFNNYRMLYGWYSVIILTPPLLVFLLLL